MYDREFFASKLGAAALVSVAAMITFNAFVLTHELAGPTHSVSAITPALELA